MFWFLATGAWWVVQSFAVMFLQPASFNMHGRITNVVTSWCFIWLLLLLFLFLFFFYHLLVWFGDGWFTFILLSLVSILVPGCPVLPPPPSHRSEFQETPYWQGAVSVIAWRMNKRDRDAREEGFSQDSLLQDPNHKITRQEGGLPIFGLIFY